MSILSVAVSLREVKPLDPLTSGFAPIPHWWLHLQTAKQARALAHHELCAVVCLNIRPPSPLIELHMRRRSSSRGKARTCRPAAVGKHAVSLAATRLHHSGFVTIVLHAFTRRMRCQLLICHRGFSFGAGGRLLLLVLTHCIIFHDFPPLSLFYSLL
jgi:hypothetical protein